MKPPDRWVSGDLPKRGSPRYRRKPTTVTPKQAERLSRLRDHELVGRPLAAALRSRTPGQSQAPKIRLLDMAPITAAVVVLVLGVATTNLMWLGAGAVLALLGGALLLRRRGTRATVEPVGLLGPLAHEIAALDAYLASVAPKLPKEALRRLATVKETLAKLLAAIGEGPRVLPLPPDEQFFSRETVSRYLPDACRHYLEAIRAGEGLSTAGGEQAAAAQSLCSQIDVLNARLERNLKLIAADKNRELADHELFIRTKG